jgi:pyruvate,water dikinase
MNEDVRVSLASSVSWRSPVEGRGWVRNRLVEALPAPVSPLCETLLLPLVAVGVRAGAFRLTREDAARHMFVAPALVTINGWAYCTDRVQVAPGMVTAGIVRFPRFGRLLQDLLGEALAACHEVRARAKHRDMAAHSALELLALIEQAALAGARHWAAAALILWYADSWERLLEIVVRAALGPGAPAVGRLVPGLPEVWEMFLAPLARLAQAVATREDESRTMPNTPPDGLLDWLAALPGGARWHDEAGRLLAAHGTLVRSLDFAQPLLSDDPAPLLEALRGLASAGSRGASRRSSPVLERAAAVASVEARLDPLRWLLVRRVLGRAQHGAALRTQALRHLGAAWPVMRRCVLELGRRLTAAGLVGEPDDAFYLTWVELQQACRLDPEQTLPDLRACAARRRAERCIWATAAPPDTVPEHTPATRDRDLVSSVVAWLTGLRAAADTAPDGTAVGVSLNGGVAAGPAFVARTLEELHDVPPGSVLVSRELAPAYWPVLLVCSAVALEAPTGRAHSAYVARELGIPAVAGLAGITARVQPGQTIVVDGDRGHIRTV